MPLSVRLAGYNLDADLISDVQEMLRAADRDRTVATSFQEDHLSARLAGTFIPEELLGRVNLEAFTPETISAAYARISRDPRPVADLRKAARHSVAKARKSNENIIFGLGHASVAEHACFNFDITGLSRLASEELQSHRLASFTEKSQRYITISPDYVLPPELAESDWKETFVAVVSSLFTGYERLTEELISKLRSSAEFRNEPEREQLIEYVTKEDCRYVLPLCCTTQMGVTMNARNVEHVVCNLSDHPLDELRLLGKELARAVSGLAPSLVKYTTRGRYPRRNRAEIAETSDTVVLHSNNRIIENPQVKLLAQSPEAEESVLKAFCFSIGTTFPGDETQRRGLWLKILEGMGEHDTTPREFELATMTFEAVVSASCFAQLKRHRMMTLLSAPYQTGAEIMLPPSIRDAGLSGSFESIVRMATECAQWLNRSDPQLSAYLLTNAHCKRVLIHVNARELYHFARLRCDAHAQWEIRRLADQIIDEAKRSWPNLMMLACGKDRFSIDYAKYYPTA